MIIQVTQKPLTEMEDCPVCFQALEWWPTATTSCGHKFHNECLAKWCKVKSVLPGWCGMEASCPLCRRKPIVIATTTCSRVACQMPALTRNGTCINHIVQSHFKYIPCGPERA